MTSFNPSQIACEQLHPNIAVRDVSAATDFYTSKLGFTLDFTWGDPPDMAGVSLGNAQMFLHRGTPDSNVCSIYFIIDSADELYDFHRNNGVAVVSPPEDRDYGIRDYWVQDLYGYELRFGQRLFNTGPPIKIERVEVPLRLEKRLAALLYDLAEHKRMSLSSCLEEMLLHSFEPLGEGVASPHTNRTHSYIQELKKKHEIDYDSHGSYRFVE